MATINLINMLDKILIYSKYAPNVTIISRPFMLIIMFEYTCNMVIYIHANPNISNYTPFGIHKTHLCIFMRLQLNWSHLQLMRHKLFFLIKTKLNVVHMER